MKIIEALKQTKDLTRKIADLQVKIAKNSAYPSNEKPVYENQKAQVSEWIQSVHDLLKEILRLKIAIQKTNLATEVVIELDGVPVTKTIAEWVIRRRDLAKIEADTWLYLTDRNIRQGTIKQSNDQLIEVTIVRCFEPAERDRKINSFQSEPTIIDGKLEIINAITDLIE
jgi:hypothetical protein